MFLCSRDLGSKTDATSPAKKGIVANKNDSLSDTSIFHTVHFMTR